MGDTVEQIMVHPFGLKADFAVVVDSSTPIQQLLQGYFAGYCPALLARLLPVGFSPICNVSHRNKGNDVNCRAPRNRKYNF
jgi:hypothetical protein